MALKIIKPGMDTRQVIARFEAERQALAMMDHPNIAKVFDGWGNRVGRPYFVMELVRASDHRVLRPEAPDRPGAAGVVHAGLPGRPARPSERDHPPRHQALERAGHDTTTRPVPKVIDFGVAKATGEQRLTEKTIVHPTSAQMIGHAALHEPRAGQAEPARRRHPQRHLLAGRLALRTARTGEHADFDQKRNLSEAGLRRIIRIIREVEPPVPEHYDQHIGPRLPSMAAHRQIEPKKLEDDGPRRAGLDRDEGPLWW